MDYKKEADNNNRLLLDIIKKERPDLEILINLLDEGGLNISILLNFIYMLNKINSGSGYGSISVDIQNHQVTFINGEEKLKITEPII